MASLETWVYDIAKSFMNHLENSGVWVNSPIQETKAESIVGEYWWELHDFSAKFERIPCKFDRLDAEIARFNAHFASKEVRVVRVPVVKNDEDYMLFRFEHPGARVMTEDQYRCVASHIDPQISVRTRRPDEVNVCHREYKQQTLRLTTTMSSIIAAATVLTRLLPLPLVEQIAEFAFGVIGYNFDTAYVMETVSKT